MWGQDFADVRIVFGAGTAGRTADALRSGPNESPQRDPNYYIHIIINTTCEMTRKRTYSVRRPEDPVHAGDLVDQWQREAERVDGRGPLRLGHVRRVLERIGVVHVLHAARQRHGYAVSSGPRLNTGVCGNSNGVRRRGDFVRDSCARGPARRGVRPHCTT